MLWMLMSEGINLCAGKWFCEIICLFEHVEAPQVFKSKEKCNALSDILSAIYSHPNYDMFLQKTKKCCALYILEMMALIWFVLHLKLKVQSSSLHQKCFHSWHLVVCKQSPFGPWVGLSDSICNILDTQTRKSMFSWIHIHVATAKVLQVL